MVSRDGKKTRQVTKGTFDLHNPFSAFGEPLVVGVDSVAGTIYYTASPENATQLYLYRSRLDGRGQPERVTPQNQPGYHLYQISRDGHWALHTYSSLGTPPVVDLVRRLDIDELLAIDAGEAGVHLRLEPCVAELRVLPLFDESCGHRR